MSDKRLYLIDATAFCYRAFYALPTLSTSFGQPTNAIYGFLNILNKILKENKPDYIAACFDVSRDTFRLKKFSEYKINRPPMPEGLSSQIPLIKQIVCAYGIPLFQKEGYEADDIIAFLAKSAKKKGLSTVIVSSDKDILQLVDSNTLVFSPYKEEGVIYDEEKVFQRFGVKPQRIPDVIALMGDDADNIPGVPGIGEKTAVSLVRDFGSLDGLLGNIERIPQEKTRKIISENIERINLNRELIVLDEEVQLDCGLDKLKAGSPDYNELFRISKYLEFKKYLKGLPAEEGTAKNIDLHEINDSGVLDLIGAKELILYDQVPGGLIFCVENNFFRVTGLGENAKALLIDPCVKKVGHDLKKLKISLSGCGVILNGLYFDVMIAAYLLNPSKAQYGLTDLAFDYLGEYVGDKITDNGMATRLILQLKPKLEEELREKSLFGLFNDLEMPLVEVLAAMELEGIKLDTEVMQKISSDIEKRLIKLIEKIYDLSGCQFNISSPKQLREVLFEKLKLPVVKRTKTGPSTDEEVLRSLANKHKLPELLLEYRQLMKLKTTYIDTLPDLIDKKTGRIHTSFNQTGTETGRLSSSNPNLQNIPIKTDIGRNIRRAVISFRPGHYLLSCDYSQIELRILAHLSKDENLIAAFKDNADIHRASASLIYGVGGQDITEAMRNTAKRVNFGIVYGLTSYGLSRDLGISVDDAQRFIDAYFVRYPGVQTYIQGQIAKAKKDGFVTTLLGRRRYIPDISNKNQGIRQFAERQAVNTPIQGSASDLIKMAMIDIHSQIRTRNLKAKMILQIHDELVFDCPEPELKELSTLAKDRMENVLELDVPVKVDMKKGQNWLDMEEVK